MATYSEKLKSPKWQKRRLEILSRDGFACKYCGNKEQTLHVHHLFYRGEPWEADDVELITLCEDCHAIQHLNLSPLERDLIDFIRGEISYHQDNSRQKYLNKLILSYKRLK